MKAYSLDLRVRVLADSDEGLPSDEVAAKHRVSRAWVDRLKQRRRETGKIGPKKREVFREQLLKPHMGRLEQLLVEKPDSTAPLKSSVRNCR